MDKNSLAKTTNNLLHNFQLAIDDGSDWRIQSLTVIFAALLTYSYINYGNEEVHVQIAIMTVLALFGAAHPQLITASGCGAFVGGQSIVPNYAWLLLFATIVSFLWCFVITPNKLLLGFGGRLGSTTFIGMNLLMVVFLGPTGKVPWNRYGDKHSLWMDRIGAVEEAVVYILAVVWLAVVGAAARKYGTIPANPVLVPVLWALGSMLVINMTEYRHAGIMYGGFAVGSYVAMASFEPQRLPTLWDFGFAGLFAAGWGLFLTPFFLGFGGKAGFTSMLGHVSYHFAKLTFMSVFFRQEEASPTVKTYVTSMVSDLEKLPSTLEETQEQEESTMEASV